MFFFKLSGETFRMKHRDEDLVFFRNFTPLAPCSFLPSSNPSGMIHQSRKTDLETLGLLEAT